MTAAHDPPRTPQAQTGPPQVSRFEYSLLRILRFVFGQLPTEQVSHLLDERFTTPPPCLSATCVHLIQDMMSKGLVLSLVRAGGWRNERHILQQQPVTGRVWERLPLESRQLSLSEHPISFLFWLTTEKLAENKAQWDVDYSELTPGDELFFALAFDVLRFRQDIAHILSNRSVFRLNPLCWLFAPAEFISDQPTPPDFSPWMTGPRSVILECYQHELTQRWVKNERSKGQIGDWKLMRLRGQAELATLTQFLTTTQKANRPDLARFVLHSASTILRGGELNTDFWIGGLQGTGPTRLADRLETQRSALVLLRQLDTLQQWDRNARSVGYWDEDYQVGQLWKSDWEAAQGEQIVARAHEILGRLEPLKTT